MPKIPPPRTGWHFVQLTDLNALDVLNILRRTCDRCNHELRFVHWLEHPAWPHRLGVGACCAVRLAVGYDAKTVEREAGKLHSRLMRFLNPARWRRNAAKGTINRKLRGERVTIRENGGQFSFVIASRWQNGFESLLSAQQAALAELLRRERDGDCRHGAAAIPNTRR